jgi:hypothetical protein
MKQAKILRIYLDHGTRQAAVDGKVRFLNLVKHAMESRGFRVEYCDEGGGGLLKSVGRGGYSLFHMKDPFHENSLTFRKVYLYPFWQIETSAKRWEWEVARTAFEPDKIDPDLTNRFAGYWRNQLFGDTVIPDRGGYVFIPLQGKLLNQRSFQSATPIEMIKATLKHCNTRQVVIRLHPNETYSPQERDALGKLEKMHTSLTVSDQDPDILLAGCDYVVAQNSGLAFKGLFLEKPAILFGEIDFHHIALNISETGIKKAFQQVETHKPDYNKYLFWFLQTMSINAGKPDIQDRILSTLRRRGWQV